MTAPGKQNRQIRFWKKFLRLTRGRVGVLQALKVIAEEEQNAAFHRTIKSVLKGMEDGKQLSEAIDGQSDVFSLSVRELVKMAEKTGAWDEVLKEVIDGLTDGTFDVG